MAEMTREWLGKSVLKGSPLRHFLLQPPELQINHLTHDVKTHVTQLNDQQQQLRPQAHCSCSLCSVGFQFEETNDRTEQKASTGTICIPVETLSLSNYYLILRCGP